MSCQSKSAKANVQALLASYTLAKSSTLEREGTVGSKFSYVSFHTGTDYEKIEVVFANSGQLDPKKPPRSLGKSKGVTNDSTHVRKPVVLGDDDRVLVYCRERYFQDPGTKVL
jgi:hypothetical protein